MKHILLAVMGTSPQVLTKTLYALHDLGRSLPDEVYVITTKNSKKKLIDGLCVQGHWKRMLNDYDMPEIKFDESHIWLIEDEYGLAINDSKAESEQSIIADFITRKVAKLTSDANCFIHASIACGRKSMAFYLGYAMSLYGLKQDMLSHVFVDDDFEFVSDFYYPTPYDNWIDGKEAGKRINTKLAKVTFAEIPFVRMRNHFTGSLLRQLEDESFSKTVASMNAVNETLDVSICRKARGLSVLGVTVSLPAKLLAMYLFILSQPERKVKVSSVFQQSTQYSQQFLQKFSELRGDVRVYQTFGLQDEGDWRRNELDSLKPMTPKFVQEVLSQFHKRLLIQLPNEVVDKMKVHSDGVKGGATYWVREDVSISVMT